MFRPGDDPEYEVVEYNGEFHQIPLGHKRYFEEVINRGGTLREALDHAKNPFRVAC